MDVAYYISELLTQHGEVNVPGLGYFAQVKVAGYYDDTTKQFFPPTGRINFEDQYVDDDILLQHIADNKRISLASSKYFTAKFIDNLRTEAMKGEVQLADLGKLHFEDTKLAFKAADVLPADPVYYGYPKIAINKLQSTSVEAQIEKEQQAPTYVEALPVQQPVPEVPIGAPPVVSEANTDHEEIFFSQPNYNSLPVESEIQEPFIAPTYNASQPAEGEEEFVFHGRGYSGEENHKNNNWIWISLTVVAILVIMGLFALYKMKPAVFKRSAPEPLIMKTPIKHDTVKAPPALKPDTASISTKTVIVDTTTKPASVNTAASTIDSTKVRFEVIGTTAPTLAAASKAVANYESMNIDAHVVNTTPGKRTFKISLGTYATHAEAMDAINALVKTGKVKPGIWPLQINPKK